MPAIVRCPNGCKLQVPVRKLFDNFQCPKCSDSLFVAQSQIDEFENDRKHILEANLSSDLVEISSADIIYLEGAPADLLVEVVDEVEEKPSPEPPPIVDHSVSDAFFAEETGAYVQPQTPSLKPGNPTAIPESAPDSTGENNSSKQRPSDPGAKNDRRKKNRREKSNERETGHDSQSSRDSEQEKPTEAPPVESVARKSTDGQSNPVRPKMNPDEISVSSGATDSSPAQASNSPDDFLFRWFLNSENPGIEHHVQNRWKAYSLGWAMVVIGVFLLGPVIYTMMQWIGKDYHLPLGRWSFLLIFFSAVQFLYAFYLFQLPDWSSTRFVSYLMLLMTVMSSFMLAVAYLSQEANNFFNFLQLSITNRQLVCGWLIVMSIGFGLMSYLCGRTTQNWMEEEKRLGSGLRV